jgi:protein gp37
MGDQTAIQWTDATWNPVTGCSKVSPGCAHCYAEAVTARYAGRKGFIVEHRPWTPANAAHNVTLWPDRLEQPLRWKRPRMVFVNSMSDLFHEQVPDGFIAWVFWTMTQCPQHTFQVLTKRPERMRDFMRRWADRLDRDEHGEPEHRAALARGPAELREKHNCGRALLMADMLEQWGEPPPGAAYPTYDWMEGPIIWPDVPQNMWLGVSIENRRYVHRADLLRETPAAVRFISAEPLIGPLLPEEEQTEDPLWADDYDGPQLYLNGIDWLIVGGESGPRHRPMDLAWIRLLRDATRCSHCDGTGQWPGLGECPPCGGTGAFCAFFFKQWGGATPKSGGRELDGRTWDEMPVRAV